MEEPTARPSRGPWIIGGSIIVAALVVAGTLIALSDDPCEAWQSEVFDLVDDFNAFGDEAAIDPDASGLDRAIGVAESAEQSERATALVARVNDLEDEKPHGCPWPEE